MWKRLFQRPQKQLQTQLLGDQTFFPVLFKEKTQLNHDSWIFRFELDDESKPLGLATGQHIFVKAILNGEEIVRKYTPVTPLEETGVFDLIIKVYQAKQNQQYPEGGKMTQFLYNLQQGDLIDIAGPAGKLVYNSFGQFEIENNQIQVEKLGIIVAGSGIAPAYQLIQHICEQQFENLTTSLVYCNKAEEDILFRPILEEWVAEQSLYLYNVLEYPPENWTQGIGRINKEIIQERMPPPGENVLICHCGMKAFNWSVREMLVELGYSPDSLFKF